MKLFSQIKWTRYDAALIRNLRKLKGTKWSTGDQAVIDFRARLLELQNDRCVYCQMLIEADQIGYRELEHVLPKSASKACTPANGHSDLYDRRRHTLGYASFTYEPQNLAVSCKQCNNFKGLFDPLKLRSRTPLRYPQANRFLWVHPLHHKYCDHIRLRRDFTFEGLSTEGKAVINECHLYDAEVLAKKFYARAVTRAKQAKGLDAAVRDLVSSVGIGAFGAAQAIDALINVFALRHDEAVKLVQLYKNIGTAAGLERALKARRAVDQRLARLGKSTNSAIKHLKKQLV